MSAQRTVNWIPELDPESKFQAVLYPRPGLKTFANAGSAEVRGRVVFDGNLFAVVGGDVKRVATNGSVTTIGTLGTASGSVSFAAGTTQYLLVDGDKGYFWNGSVLAQVSDGDFPNGATVADFIDGRFIVNDPATKGRFNISNANDASAWDALEAATAQRSPDALTSILVDHREVWLFGDNSTEVWFNSGGADFPLEPIQGGFTETGILAPFSAAKIGDFVYWLGTSDQGQGVVLRAPGLRGEPISTPAVEDKFASYTQADLQAATAGAMWLRGHALYVLQIPNSGTWVHDSSTNLWHEWKTYGLDFFRGQHPVFWNGKHYVGDYQDGNIFELDFDTYTDNGQPIERIRVDRHIVSSTNRERVRHSKLELEFEMGQGTASLDPKVMMRYSDDAGHTFSNELWRGLGKVGKYKNKAEYNRLGQTNDRLIEVKTTDAFKSVLVGGWVDLAVGK